MAAYLDRLSRRDVSVCGARRYVCILERTKFASTALRATYGDEKYTLANTKPKTVRTMKAGSEIALPL